MGRWWAESCFSCLAVSSPAAGRCNSSARNASRVQGAEVCSQWARQLVAQIALIPACPSIAVVWSYAGAIYVQCQCLAGVPPSHSLKFGLCPGTNF